MNQSSTSMSTEGVMGEPPITAWDGVQALSKVKDLKEFEPFHSLLHGCVTINKTAVQVKSKAVDASELGKPVDTVCKQISTIKDAMPASINLIDRRINIDVDLKCMILFLVNMIFM